MKKLSTADSVANRLLQEMNGKALPTVEVIIGTMLVKSAFRFFSNIMQKSLKHSPYLLVPAIRVSLSDTSVRAPVQTPAQAQEPDRAAIHSSLKVARRKETMSSDRPTILAVGHGSQGYGGQVAPALVGQGYRGQSTPAQHIYVPSQSNQMYAQGHTTAYDGMPPPSFFGSLPVPSRYMPPSQMPHQITHQQEMAKYRERTYAIPASGKLGETIDFEFSIGYGTEKKDYRPLKGSFIEGDPGLPANITLGAMKERTHAAGCYAQNSDAVSRL
ncbi:hypothetical protein F5890DRAFT_1477702 [Lentinula detonsa]|uniref:Uncharacterized protein n=1 Tax=Lentinula detonsa TaxID=2804962 RepID=A0AA38PSE7_9AGAR|nr:hypothetical protein F5890DRAFT_1477702 [Lentinula detonsa]